MFGIFNSPVRLSSDFRLIRIGGSLLRRLACSLLDQDKKRASWTDTLFEQDKEAVALVQLAYEFPVCPWEQLNA